MQDVRKSMLGVNFALILLVSSISSLGIISLVFQATGWKMPSWLAWTVLGIGAAGTVAGLLSTYGGVAVSGTVMKLLLNAGTVAL